MGFRRTSFAFSALLCLLLAAGLFLTAGCGTISNNDTFMRQPLPYGGLVTDYAMATGNQPGCGPWWFLDMPFSFLGDTVSLPFNAHFNHQVKQFEQSRTNEPGPNPLSGWKSSPAFDYAIMSDYQAYIQKLPTEERYGVRKVDFLEDGTGQRAIRVYIHLSGTWWEHDLIYDQSNGRVQATKRISGRFRS